MSEDFNRKKDIFMNQYASAKEYIIDEEYNKLSEEEKAKYYYDYNKSQRYFDKPLEFSDDELNTYINMKIFDSLEKLNSKTDTIKNILIFWLMLTIIGLIIILFTICIKVID